MYILIPKEISSAQLYYYLYYTTLSIRILSYLSTEKRTQNMQYVCGKVINNRQVFRLHCSTVDAAGVLLLLSRTVGHTNMYFMIIFSYYLYSRVLSFSSVPTVSNGVVGDSQFLRPAQVLKTTSALKRISIMP